MSYRPSYVPGDYNAMCDVCGFKFKASELKDRWDGLKVCEKDWEPRHEMDFLKAPKGENSLPWTRPEPADRETSVTYADLGTDDDIPAGNTGSGLPGASGGL